MELPERTRKLIAAELKRLRESGESSLPTERRREILASIGAVSDGIGYAHSQSLAPLNPADTIRARIALITARRLAELWEQACRETEAYFCDEPRDPEEPRREEAYPLQRQQAPIEFVSVYDVPRARCISHIIEMTECVLSGNISDLAAFRQEANEWWSIYPRPEEMEREAYIKWAAQEALYVALGWHHVFMTDWNYEPATEALWATAGIFEGKGADNRTGRLDPQKEREFWIWWLSVAFEQAAEQTEAVA